MLGARTGRLGEEVFVVDDGMERARERATAIEGFVDRLTRVREAAGDPSFRLMAKRSGAISHATLHDAVQGARLPSWTTVVEFAKACGADPDQLRAAWEQAERVISASGVPDPEPAAPAPSDPAPVEPPIESAVAEPAPAEPEAAPPADDVRPAHRPDDLPEPTPPRPTRPAPALLAGAAALGAALSLGAVATYGALADDDPAPAAALTPSSAPRGPSAQAAGRTEPCITANTATYDPAVSPRSRDDGAKMAGESPPDCRVYAPGEMLTKTWTLRNTGDLAWEGRKVRRIDPQRGKYGCSTPEEVAIPRTPPGGTAQVSVRIKTPTVPGACHVRWMMVDRDGNYAFPGQKPFFFSLVVR